MANYATLKAAIADVVKTNGEQAITGANLQSVLLAIVNSIGAEYTFAGVATPSTSVGTPDQNVFYIGGAGTYANFGTSVTIPIGYIVVFSYNGSWSYGMVNTGFEYLDALKADKDLGSNIVNPAYVEIGKYIKTNGTVASTGNAWRVSGYILTLGKDIITNAWTGSASGTNIASIAVYDGSKQFLRYLQETDQYTYQDGEVYIRFTVSASRTPQANYGTTLHSYEPYTEHSTVDFMIESVDDYYTQLARLQAVNLVDNTQSEYGKYIYKDGRILTTEQERYSVSDYIPVFGCDIMHNGYRDSADTIHSYNVYDKDKNLLRTVYDRNATYIYQDGDAYVRICFNKKGTECAYYNSYPPIKGYLQDRAIHKASNTMLADIHNGYKDILCTNLPQFASDVLRPSVCVINEDYWYMEHTNGGNIHYLRTVDLFPDMAKYIYIDLVVYNPLANDAKFYMWASKSQEYVPASTVKLVDAVIIPSYSFKSFHIPVDMSNLSIYYGYTDSISLWMYSGEISGAVTTAIQVSRLEVYQLLDEKTYNNFAGENMDEIISSIDQKISTMPQSSANEQFLVSPNGDKYLLQVNTSGNIVLIPLYPDTVFYFGNSLTNGLAASAPQYRYRSLIDSFIQDNISGTLSSSNLRAHSFEMSHTLQDAKDNADLAIAACPSDAGLVIVQIGDNVSASDYTTVFEPALDYLTKGLRTKAQGARVIFIAAWYGNSAPIVQSVANKYGSLFVNIRDLNVSANQSYIGAVRKLDTSDTHTVDNVSNVSELTPDTGYTYKLSVTFTVSSSSYISVIHANSYSLDSTTLTYTSDESVVQTSGEASHPGDRGMKAIANRVLYNSGMTDNSEYYNL